MLHIPSVSNTNNNCFLAFIANQQAVLLVKNIV